MNEPTFESEMLGILLFVMLPLLFAVIYLYIKGEL